MGREPKGRENEKEVITGRESVSQWGGGKGEEYMNECTDRMRTNLESEREEIKVGESAFIRF